MVRHITQMRATWMRRHWTTESLHAVLTLIVSGVVLLVVLGFAIGLVDLTRQYPQVAYPVLLFGIAPLAALWLVIRVARHAWTGK